MRHCNLKSPVFTLAGGDENEDGAGELLKRVSNKSPSKASTVSHWFSPLITFTSLPLLSRRSNGCDFSRDRRGGGGGGSASCREIPLTISQIPLRFSLIYFNSLNSHKIFYGKVYSREPNRAFWIYFF